MAQCGSMAAALAAVDAAAVASTASLTVVAPVLDRAREIEYSVHRPSAALLKDLSRVFLALPAGAPLLVVPTMQRSRVDLVVETPEVAEEKDRLLENFCQWAMAVTAELERRGEWADFTDPCSGFPVRARLAPPCALCDELTFVAQYKSQRGASPYPDVSGAQLLLKYTVIQNGCCPLVSHPKWGTRCYPATLFTTAPLSVLQAALQTVSAGN